MIKKRSLLAKVSAAFLMIAAGLGTMLSAQEKKESAKPLLKIPLRVMNLPDPRGTSPGIQIELALLREFKKMHPDIELSAFSGIQLQNVGSESRLMLAIAGGAAPDIIEVNFRMSDTYIQQNFLYPLDEFIAKSDEYKSVKNFLDKTAPAIQPVLYRTGPAVAHFKKGKHVWLLGNNPSIRLLNWRKDVFREAGMDPERPPKTWDELLEFARKLSDPARDKFGISITSGAQAAWDFLPYIWGAGGEIVVQDKDGNWKAAFGSREGAIALDFYLKLIMERWQDSDGVTQYGYSTANGDSRAVKQALQAGKLGMLCTYLSDKAMGSVDASLLGQAPFPVGPAGISATEINATLFGIFAGIEARKNSDGILVSAEKIREAAWKYLLFLNSKQARKTYTEAMVALGMGRSLGPSYLREFGYTEYLKYLSPELEATYNYALKHGKPEPYGRNCQMVYIYLTKPLDEAVQMVRDGHLPEGDEPEVREKRLQILQDILKRAENRTNARMIGHITKEERHKQTTVAVIVFIFILAMFCFVIYNIWKTFSPKDSYSGKTKGFDFRRNWPGYLIMIPALLSIALWVYYPMITGSQLFFQEYRVVGDSKWIGFDNLAGVLFSDEWWAAIWNTFRYMTLMLSLGFLAPIILAILLQEVSHGKIIYRTLYYLPAVMSGLVVMFMWKLFYQSGSTGVLNQVISNIAGWFGITTTPIAWLQDANWAMLACVIPVIWSSAGPGCLIYLAALKGVPDETYEAAEIDGANFFQKIWHVTLPTLKSLIIINFVGAFIAASQSGGMILVMTFGQANTEVAELHIFKEAYTNLKFGSAICMAWVLGVMTLLFTIYNLKRLSKMEFKTTGK
ncbi:MAG: extracellular solute-binding protein [Lentisphaeria bacterium]|nr:extracellular solute-binding protein [Lentisphaeria bacterium]